MHRCSTQYPHLLRPATHPCPPPSLCFVQVIRGGPCFEVLRPGDVLLRVNGTLCTHFLPLEEALDNTLAVKQAALGLPSELGMANPRAGTGA